jgi:type I restriction enzyme S subunit
LDDSKVQPQPTMPADLLEGYKETELGLLPEEWETAELGQLVDQGHLLIKNGFAQGAFNEVGQGVPHLRPFNVTSGGQMDFSQIKYIPPPLADSPHWLLSGDVVFNNTNSEELVHRGLNDHTV